MPRQARSTPGGLVYHVINRSVARWPLMLKDADYQTFEKTIVEALAKEPIRLLGYCIMPNHWHMVVWPRRDDDVSNFFRWLTHTHSVRWHAQHKTAGFGHVYQGRFKSFPVEVDEYFYTVMHYVERNAQRAKLVKKAEQWRWSSLWHRQQADDIADLLHDWPLDRPKNWLTLVNAAQAKEELETLRKSVNRGTPLGSEAWQKRIAKRLGLESTMRPRGRPRKVKV